MGRTKALIEVDGVPMARRVADALGAAGCERVVACGGDPDELAPLGLAVLADRYPAAGPLGGVLGVLESLGSSEPPVAGVFVVACDLPALTGRSLRGMVRALRARPEIDVVVARTLAIEPACAIWNPAATEHVRRCFEAGERALHAAIARLDSIEIDVDASELRNINTPDELAGYP
jgi:molybdenum cofactor guanylyltransferase